jgi:hypothetical protein
MDEREIEDDGWVDGRLADEWVDRWNGWMDGMNEWMDGWMDG